MQICSENETAQCLLGDFLQLAFGPAIVKVGFVEMGLERVHDGFIKMNTALFFQQMKGDVDGKRITIVPLRSDGFEEIGHGNDAGAKREFRRPLAPEGNRCHRLFHDGRGDFGYLAERIAKVDAFQNLA
jgi:hypothetical protein